ncbi:extracellular solute-binding protein [Mesorhizobium australicum]|uniref:Peptide/nickel transport system substrate-binding protein n=1 Tax=Mesorhizobium australicum TaxID=536018 RepID=A0A1X7PCI9_9HYPH|nr:extracellular solute-binding protein [Mesorhizobium australicum]SMH47975.1 peptide/nickel transport system substrate-binding protein [Mesorhizobium australicum]
MLRPLSLALAALLALAPAADAQPSHGLSMHGQPALPADFDHFPYANPEAPKGGVINYALQGTFDSLNPFIVQGQGASGIVDLQRGYNIFDSLMQRSADEPFSMYPLLAKSVETDDARSFVEFQLDERAKFSDGQPVTPDDVIFSLELLRDKGWPRYATTVKKIATMEKVAPNGVRLTFVAPDRELPLILSLWPILPKHATDAENFARSSLKPLIGSGPYVISSVRPGELLVLKRNPDYWATDLPSRRGFNNYDEIRLNYFRDDNAMFEAFKKGLIDVHIEADSSRWAKDYGFPAVAEGKVIKDTFRSGVPSGMLGFVLNSRRPVLQDKQLRRALADLLDFEWVNANLFGNSFTRTKSFYDNSSLSSFGTPASEGEKALLAPFPDAVDPDILAGTWKPPVSDGSGRDRAFVKRAYDILVAAGYKRQGSTMVSPSGEPVAFEIMLKSKGGEPVALAWQRTLALLGIRLDIRSVDDAQYQQRLISRDFDAILNYYPSSLSPGVEQVGRWGSASKDAQGSMNYAGVGEPAVDAMIDALLNARDRPAFEDAVRAYDRVLLSGAWVVPLYHQPEQWVARWNHIGRPDTTPLTGYQLTTWWRQP